MARAMRHDEANLGMVAASRTLLCISIALASVACGVVLPPAEDVEGKEPGAKEPVSTKGATTSPPPNGSDGEPGVSVPGTDGSGGEPPMPTTSGPRVYFVFVTSQSFASD